MKTSRIALGTILITSLQLVVCAQTKYDPKVLPKGYDYFELRDGLSNCRQKFLQEKTGRVAFLGGSITAMKGWRELVMAYLEKTFPETKFEFIGAGIGSLGSVAHAFRLEQDVLSHGPIDLLFVEAAVNDASNTGREPERMLRGMEGVVRHARIANPMTDIVQMHFAMPNHLADYEAGRVPVAIQQHEKVAVAYGNPSLNLAREVGERIAAGEFNWDKDFGGLHPAPFGHKLYANSIARLLDAAWAKPAEAKPHPIPESALDPLSYFNGRFSSLEKAKVKKGFRLVQDWQPAMEARTRPGFVHVPVLTGNVPGAEFEFSFTGRGVGLMVATGPDAGNIEASIDNGPLKKVAMRGNAGIYLPQAVILDDTLERGDHTVKVRITEEANPKTKGTALHVFKFLEN
jgi:sialidase-1